MSSTTIDDLPDEILVKVFSHLSSRDILLNITFVSPRWALLQPKALESVSSLCLSDQPDPQWNQVNSFFLDDEEKPDLLVRFQLLKHRYRVRKVTAADTSAASTDKTTQSFDIKLNLSNCDLFSLRFTNLTSLTIVSKGYHHTAVIVAMLPTWAQRLTHLKLVGYFDWALLRDALNQMKNLKCLSVSVDCSLVNGLSPQLLDKLDELYFHCAMPSLFNLTTINNNIAIRQFGFEVPRKINQPSDISQWAQVTEQKLTHLKMFIDSEVNLARLCSKCLALTNLQLTMKQFDQLGSTSSNLEKILRNISNLTKLTELFLCIEGTNSDSQCDDNNNPFGHIPPFKSVKKAQFLFTINRKQIPFIEALFPNLTEPVQFCVNFIPEFEEN